METKTKIYIAVVPWDYSTAEAVVFDSREKAEQYIAEEIDPKAKPYATIQTQESVY